MSRKLTPFFATHGDLISIASEANKFRAVDFLQGGLFAEHRLAALTNIEELGAFQTYIVVDHGVAVEFRTVPQREGGQLYALDQLNNSHTISLQTGGAIGNCQLIAGQMGTVAISKPSEEIFSLFARVIRKRFERVKSYYVGPEAAVMLDSGARLSPTLKAPPLFDLVR